MPVFSSSTAIGDSIIAQDAGATIATVSGALTTTGTLTMPSITDSTASTGSAGQVLTAGSGGGSIEWGAAAASYTKWVLTGQSGTQDIEDGNTVLITSGNTAITTAAAATDTLTITSTAFGGGATIGHVPDASGGTDTTKFLRGDGTWQDAGGLPTRTVDIKTGDGTTVDFTLSVSPTSTAYIDVYIAGVYQQKSTYSLSGAVVTFSTAPPTTVSNGIEFVSLT